MLARIRRWWKIRRFFDGSQAALWLSYCDVKIERDRLRDIIADQNRIIGDLTVRHDAMARKLDTLIGGQEN